MNDQTDERAKLNRKEEFHYEGGIKEFVKYQNASKEPIHPDILYFEAKGRDRTDKGDMEVEVALQYTEYLKANPVGFMAAEARAHVERAHPVEPEAPAQRQRGPGPGDMSAIP